MLPNEVLEWYLAPSPIAIVPIGIKARSFLDLISMAIGGNQGQPNLVDQAEMQFVIMPVFK